MARSSYQVDYWEGLSHQEFSHGPGDTASKEVECRDTGSLCRCVLCGERLAGILSRGQWIEAERAAAQGRLSARADAELLEDARDMVLGGEAADNQRVGDRRIAGAA